MNGIEPDLNTNIIKINITAIELIFTLLKSWSAISTKSFIRGASPARIPSSSYLFITSFILFNNSFSSFVAVS